MFNFEIKQEKRQNRKGQWGMWSIYKNGKPFAVHSTRKACEIHIKAIEADYRSEDITFDEAQILLEDEKQMETQKFGSPLVETLREVSRMRDRDYIEKAVDNVLNPLSTIAGKTP